MKTQECIDVLFETMTQGVIFHDSEGKIISANPAALKILGLSEEKLYGRTTFDPVCEAIHEDGSVFSGAAHPAMLALKEGRKVSNAIMGITNLAENSCRWININAVPLYRNGEKHPYQVFVTMDDITEQKKYSDELKRKNLELTGANKRLQEEIFIHAGQDWELKKNEQLLRLFIEHAPAAIAMLDKDMNYIITSRRYLSDYNLISEQDLTGRNHYDIFPEIPDRWKEIHKRCLAGATEHADADSFPRPDGHTDWVRWEILPWYTFGGETGGIIILSEVITERILAVEELKKAKERAETSNKELEQFAYVASHDLQEPLRMITSYTKLLSKKYKGMLDEQADQYITFASDGAKRMQTLISDLLMFSRLTTKAKPLEPTDFNSVIETVLLDLKLLIQENNAEIIYSNLPVVNSDPTQIRQLFQNLIENAIKFHHPSRKPVIRITAERTDGQWLFSIEDNGIGIEPKFFERIFITFQRLHERDKYTGNGIGLAACKKIIERHGGKIWLESEPGKGSIFHFTLA